MRLFKTIDILIQLFILFAIGINYLLQGQKDAALFCVICFGSWQILSSLIQFFLKFNKTWWRLAYSIVGVGILCLLLAIKLKKFSLENFIEFMLVLAPVMGVYYFILSIVETVWLYKNKQSNDNLIID